MEMLIGILIPFIGTVAGSACVYFMKNKLNQLITPTAIPSGILCKVTANTSIVDFFN